MPYPVVQWKRYIEGARDDYGKPRDAWAAPVPIRADFAPTRSEEPRDGLTTRVVFDAQLVLDKPIDYDARDKFLVDGVEYEAEGVGGATAGLFHMDELLDLDRLLGGGARTYRTPAPDAQRYLNRYSPVEFWGDDELGEVELPAPGGWYV